MDGTGILCIQGVFYVGTAVGDAGLKFELEKVYPDDRNAYTSGKNKWG